MKSKILTTSVLLGLSVLLSACTLSPKSQSTEPISETPVLTPTVTDTPTPTLSQDTSVGAIESELKSTVILNEDFSDIK